MGITKWDLGGHGPDRQCNRRRPQPPLQDPGPARATAVRPPPHSARRKNGRSCASVNKWRSRQGCKRLARAYQDPQSLTRWEPPAGRWAWRRRAAPTTPLGGNTSRQWSRHADDSAMTGTCWRRRTAAASSDKASRVRTIIPDPRRTAGRVNATRERCSVVSGRPGSRGWYTRRRSLPGSGEDPLTPWRERG